jgi:hypothetical protein
VFWWGMLKCLGRVEFVRRSGGGLFGEGGAAVACFVWVCILVRFLLVVSSLLWRKCGVVGFLAFWNLFF